MTFFLTGAAAFAEAPEIRGIRGLAGESFWEANAAWLIPVVIIVVIGLMALAFWLGKKYGAAKPLSPRETAMQQLAAASPLIEDDTPDADKRYSFAVSDALRGYLERALGLRAPEQTTEEFLQTAKSDARLGEEALKSLGAFLGLCDLTKFARHAFGREERIQLLDTARTFIEQQDKSPALAAHPSEPDDSPSASSTAEEPLTAAR
ncbi:MAG: hypothetical protein AAGA45_03385 [Verrucomicrobiota bacterium]